MSFIFWCVVIVLIVYLLEGFINASDSTLTALSKNYLALISIFFAAIGAFLFWASAKTFQDVKNKGKIMNLLKPNKAKEIDMSEATLAELSRQLTNCLTAPTPIIFKGWANQRLMLDVERVRILVEYINVIRDAGDSYIKLKADSLISFEKIQILANTELNMLKTSEIVSEIALMKAKKDYVIEVENQKIELESKKLDLDSRRNEIEYANDNHKLEVKDKELDLMIKQNMALLETDKRTAENRILILKAKDDSRLKRKVGDLFDKIIEDLRVDNITPSQVLLLVNMLGNNPINSFDDYESKKRMIDAEIDKMRQEAEIKKQEVRTKSYEADHKLFKMELEKLNLG